LGDRAVPGGWAQYVAVDAANTHPIAQNVSFREACLAEPTAVCYESFMRAQLRPGQSVLIIGDGPFGFLHAQHARVLGAAKVVVAGHYDKRLERIAAVSGALVCNTHHQSLEEFLAREVESPGVDVAVEATGAASSPNIGLRALRPRGTLVIFSYIWKPEAIDMGLISIRELHVVGSARSLRAFEPCLEMVADGRLNTTALVSLQVPLAEGPAALEALRTRKGDIFKAVLLPFDA
jgi:threonine dehydrogenase-like Zn-dependent dehydrogenase